MKILSFSAVALAIAALAACAGNIQGLRVGVGTGQSEGHAAQQQSKTGAAVPADPAREGELYAGKALDGAAVIVVGETGTLTRLDGAARADFYAAYLKARQREGAPHSAVRQAAFVNRIGGLSSIETYKVGGFYLQDLPLVLPAAEIDRTAFASTAGSLLAGTTGDLVAARNDADGLLVLERVLCKAAAPNYRACLANFAKGRFDARTGGELDTGFKPKAGGARIDTATYRSLPAG